MPYAVGFATAGSADPCQAGVYPAASTAMAPGVPLTAPRFTPGPPIVALPMSRITTLVTDDGLSDEDAQMVRDAGVNLIVAETGGATQ